ncbi:MAG: N-acetylmuramoyl-L-alanine amidase [Pricia sp.]
MKASKYSRNTDLKRLFLFPFGGVLVLLLTSFYTNTFTDTVDKRNDNKFTVVLDAGHGGHDPGNLGNGYKEKNIALNIVLKAGALLEKNPDIEVIYTRKDDTFVDLYVRGEIANKAGADLFVSVHCDSHTSKAQGAGTFVLGLHANKQNFEIAKKENSVIYLEDDYKSRYADYDINSPESVIGLTIMQEEFLDQSIALAKAIQDNFSKKLNRVDRKVKQAGFIVLHQTFMPSVLVETGFLTNNEEGAYLNSSKGQSQMGTAIAEAVLTYKKDAMANIADFNPGTVVKVPEPEDRAGKRGKTREARNESSDEPGEVVVSAEPAVSVVERKANLEREKAQREAADLEREKTLKEEAAKEKAQREAADLEREKVLKEEAAKERAQREAADLESEKAMKEKASEDKAEIIYKVQLMASAKDLPLRPASFNGLSKVAKEPIKNLYRYVYGHTSSVEEAKMLKSNADMKGYPTSFIVVYRNGERISFRESKKYISGQ